MPSRDIKDCCTELQEKWPKLKAAFEKKHPGWKMILTCTHRAPEEQLALYKKGRKLIEGQWVADGDGSKIVTHRDGYKLISKHNEYPARAFDVALINPQGKAAWDNAEWGALPELCKKLDLVSGLTWSKLRDGPHVETEKHA